MATSSSHGDNSQDEGDESNVEDLGKNYLCTVAGVCEMKNSKKSVNQLIANMVHFGSQITVKALKEGEVINHCITYGLGINYKEKEAIFMKLVMDLDTPKTTVENYGVFPLAVVFNNRLITK